MTRDDFDPIFDSMRVPLDQLVRRIVWCTVASVDRRDRPRSRILHPLWQLESGKAPLGWIMTGRASHKAKHLIRNPYLSLTYWDPQHEQAIFDCQTRWRDEPAEKQRIWQLFADTPQPYGYDPAQFFGAADDPGFGVLELTPWRIETWSLQAMAKGEPPSVWRADDTFELPA